MEEIFIPKKKEYGIEMTFEGGGLPHYEWYAEMEDRDRTFNTFRHMIAHGLTSYATERKVFVIGKICMLQKLEKGV